MRKFAAVGLLASCLPALAWGPEGHALVARIAEAQLMPAARARVQEILGPGSTMVSVSSWADQIRNERRETGPWHYIDIPINKPHLNMERDCPKGDCVIAKIEQFRDVLKDPATPPQQRREALMFVIHFVGDMHQPLHCSDNQDHGGNEVHLVFLGHPTNLHSFWDTTLVSRMGTEDALFPKFLAAAQHDRKRWDKGSVRDWAEQSHKAAQKIVYGKLPKAALEPHPAGSLPAAPIAIPAGYEQAADPWVARQIEEAGARLAFLLNQTLQ
jgi:hypothetical protein